MLLSVLVVVSVDTNPDAAFAPVAQVVVPVYVVPVAVPLNAVVGNVQAVL